MQRIDSHQHFWQFNPVRDSWITEEMAVIQRDFLPEDLEPVLKENCIDGCVVVQSDQSEAENTYQLANAGKHDFIKGIVGWVDFWAEDVEERLSALKQYPKLKGFRYVLQGAEDPAIMLHPAFMRGISKLRQFGYTYDVLIFPNQLKPVREFVAAFPDQPFVVDHLAKPDIRGGKIEEWKKDMLAVAANENTYCKISGMVTEADWQNWKKEDFRPYLDVIVEAFGTKRIMFGSDWPVCLVAASYKEVLGIVEDYFSSFTAHERELFFGGNATTFYKL